MLKRRLHVNPATAWMPVIVCLAVTLRLVLMKLNWPVANADESTIDLMARHIAYLGEHPIFFWGQNYMGALQAYMGAILIHFFGSSAFTVRLGTLLIFTLYIVCMYFLVYLLYTPAYALFIIALLSIGSDRMIGIPLVANGGYAETMLFGACIFLGATWLALTAPQERRRAAWPRLLIYAGLGVVIGLAFWSDQLILAGIFTAALFLWLCCRQEIGWLAMLALLAGVLVGAAPLILYNLSAAPGQNSLNVLVGTVFSGTPRVIPFSQQFAQALLISLPLGTGMPFSTGIHAICGTSEPYLHPVSSLAALFPSSNAWLCLGTRGGWSLGFLFLWGVALVGALTAIRRLRKTRQERAGEQDAQRARQQRVRVYARLMLLGSGALWLLLFTFSAAAQSTPRASSRYLICLLFAVPALLWPLWQGVVRVRERFKQGQRFVKARAALSALGLCIIAGTYLVGTGDIFANLPVSQNTYNQRNALVKALLDHGATRVYSDYNTCNLLIFQSDERVICGVLNDQLQPGINRYAPYLTLVESAPHPAYLFPATSAPAQALVAQLGQNAHYQYLLLDGYSIYFYSPAG